LHVSVECEREAKQFTGFIVEWVSP